MTITLIGCGCGSLTEEAAAAIQEADLLIGSSRLLDRHGMGKRCVAAVTAEAIAAAVKQEQASRPCVLFSGDSGFYSGARLLAQARHLPIAMGRLGRTRSSWRS